MSARLVKTLIKDIRFQFKYGFYFLYVFMTVMYTAIIYFVPSELRPLVASIVLMSDPAALGFFFIGGIWLLEEGEGVHIYELITPQKTIEYIVSKLVSLGFISTLSGAVICVFSLPETELFMLIFGLFTGSAIFTLLGLYVASYAKSVNHYMLINVLPGTIMVFPAVITAFDYGNALFELFPATALWRIIEASTGDKTANPLSFVMLLLWLVFALFLTNKRLERLKVIR